MQPKQLDQTCPICGEPLVVMEELQPSVVDLGRSVWVATSAPICRNGHELVPA